MIKIGRPGYKVTKARDLTSNQRSLLFEVDYPEAEDGAQPRHRFMSAYEQKVEAPDKGYQVQQAPCARGLHLLSTIVVAYFGGDTSS